MTTETRREPSSDAVLAELGRILASERFVQSDRRSRFLRFLVEQALEGHAGRLSEHVLAIELFNRKPSFDPASDPIVRAEAAKLRHKLQEYYQTDGKADPLTIELPQRTYVPVFRKREEPAPEVISKRSWMPAWGTWQTTLLAGTATALVALAAYWAWAGLRSSPRALRTGDSGMSAGTHSIVVLPFTDLSANHDQEYFCDGLTEEVTETLTDIEGLRVIARTTAFHFKGKTADVREIGKQLNVDLILEGSVRRAGDRLRVAAHLIDALDGYEMWARTYDRQIQNIFEIEQAIAHGIAATVRTELARRGRRPLTESPHGVEAYDLYLKGLYSARQWTTEGLTQAVSQLQRAIAQNPDHAPAFAALAEYYVLLGLHAGLDPKQVMPKAKTAALKALELDDSISDAHAVLALVKAVYDWDWPGAEQSFHRALELDPTDADEREMYTIGYLLPQARLNEALKEVREALSSEPIYPRLESTLGMVYYFRREYDLAIAQLQKSLRLDPELEDSHLTLGSAYAQQSRFAEAIASLEEGKAAWGSGVGTSMLGHTYALMGRRSEAEKLIQELVQLSKTRYVSPCYIANIYAGLGDKDRTMAWLEKAYEARAVCLVYLKVDSRYDSVRSDPRFTSLLKKIHLD